MNETQIKEKLNSYRMAKRDIEAAIGYLKWLDAQAQATGNAAPKEVMVKSSNPIFAKFENAICDKADLEKLVLDETIRLESIKAEVEELIALAGDGYKSLLDLRYIHEARWEVIAEMLDYSVQNVYVMHNKAVKKILKRLE